MCVLFQPICQVRYTNVATVKLKVNGEKFEVACYKNKILNWRSGIENDIHEVLQSPHIFSSISKGKLANNAQLMKAFDTTNVDVIIKKILDKGEFQVSKEERNTMLKSIFNEIVSILHEITINPNTGHRLSRNMLENALKTSGFSISLNENVKKQALKALNLLQKSYPNNISRSKMRLKINFVGAQYDQIMDFLNANKDILVEQNNANRDKGKRRHRENEGGEHDLDYMVLVCPPNLYNNIENLINNLDPPGTIQLITLNMNHNVNVNDAEQSDDDEPLGEAEPSQMDRESHELEAKKTQQDVAENRQPEEIADKLSTVNISETQPGIKCINCNVTFDDNALYRKHFKSDFHVFNCKRKLQNLSPISYEEYEHIVSNISNA